MQTHLHRLLKIFGWTTKVLVFFFLYWTEHYLQTGRQQGLLG